MRSRIIAIVTVISATTLLLGAACGDDDDDGATATGTAPAAATSTSGAYPSEVQLTDGDNGATVRLARGGTLIVALQSNPSTGFSWSVSEGSGAGLDLDGEPAYVPPGSTTPVVGAAGTQVFTFTAVDEPATVQLMLEYKRSFEPGVEPEQTFEVTVQIE